jgi:hypothetical protein
MQNFVFCLFNFNFLRWSIIIDDVPSWPKAKSTRQIAKSPAFKSFPECRLKIFSAMVFAIGKFKL